jgi:mono/diheme cytochrome c family protein
MQKVRIILMTTGVGLSLRMFAAAQEPSSTASGATPAKALYERSCARCHGTGEGNEKMASLLQVSAAKLNLAASRLTPDQIEAVLRKGRGKMPAFLFLGDAQLKDLSAYVKSLQSAKSGGKDKAIQ